MAHILIPTDHSENALNAAIYAVQLHGATGDRYTVLHAYGLPHGTGGNLVNIDKELALAANEDTERFMIALRNALPGMEADFTVRCEKGPLRTVIGHVAEEYGEPDLIVMGTQGASGLKRVLMGSHTAAVMQDGRIPVLAVPEEARYKPFERIVVADDGGQVDGSKVEILLDLARRSGASIRIVRVRGTDAEPGGTATAYGTILGDIPHTFEEIPGTDISAALQGAVEAHDADLFVVLHRKRGIFDQLFHKSVASRMVMHTRIPMLVLHQGA